MSGILVLEDDDDDPRRFLAHNPRETWIQILLSLTLGITAFLAFCILRPRWASLYGARRRTRKSAAILPELPGTMFGWIVPLWKVTDQQVLASAGLDAYVFLAFFKMALRFLAIVLFFALVIIKPIHDANPEESDDDDENDPGRRLFRRFSSTPNNHTSPDRPRKLPWKDTGAPYLWMYVFFAYLFSALAIYFVITETKRIIAVRQEYLGTQTTISDRTIRLEGVPKELQTEEKIKEFVEELDIGKVESVTICRDWGELDEAMTKRMDILRRLEEAYTIYQKARMVERNMETLPIAQPEPPNPAPTHSEGNVPYARERPKANVRYGLFSLRSRQVDAIDYYEEQLRKQDELVKKLREKDFNPTPLAFVTMDSVAAAQVATQAVLDPSPFFLAYASAPPSDIIWPNTYMSRRNRGIRGWIVTVIIVLLTVFWSALYVPIAGLLTPDTIGKVIPGARDFLEDHENIKSLVTTQLPTLLVSLLNVLAPYLYYYLSWYQGMLSQGEIELSAISKNFFFLFVNFFLVFTVLGTGAKFYQFLLNLGDSLDKTFQGIALALAEAFASYGLFFRDFIILQGLGLFPFRLLEAGSVSMYSVYRLGAKTPRDYAELVQPPVFSYGFYLPSALLIFIICLTYCILRTGWATIMAGITYFALGHFVYKYQLLYAMEHQQQSLGKSWGMMCDRVFIGLVAFQATTAGELVLKNAVARSILIVPLIMSTIWIATMYGRTYKPLMKFIALRSVRRGEPYTDDANGVLSPETQSIFSNSEIMRNVWAETRIHTESRRRPGHAHDDDFDTEQAFVNPNLVVPLKGAWIADKNLVGDADRNLSPSSEDEHDEGSRYRDSEDVADDEADNTV